MIVILEGPRGVGKTTLANQMVEALRIRRYEPEIVKAERGDNPTMDMIETIAGLKFQEENNPRKAYIIDRFHLTEFVMRTIDQSVPRLKLLEDLIILSKMMEANDAAVVYVKCDSAERRGRVLRRADGRGDEPENVDKVWDYCMSILNGYNGLGVFDNIYVADTSATPKEKSPAVSILYRIWLRAEMKAKKEKGLA